jgi:hypothetical protein
MPAHIEGHEGNLPVGSQIIPSMGLRVCQLLATLCVASFLALFTQGGADPAGRFCL